MNLLLFVSCIHNEVIFYEMKLALFVHFITLSCYKAKCQNHRKSSSPPNILANVITLLCKDKCKSNNQLPVLNGLLGFLKFNYHVDKRNMTLFKRSRIDSLFNKWEKLTNYFD